MGDAHTPGIPVYLELARRSVVVVGGGDDATALASALLAHSAAVTVVARAASPQLRFLAASGRITLLARAYVRGDLAGAALAACFEAGEIAVAVAAEASAERCLVIVAERPELSTVRLIDHISPQEPTEESA